MASTEWDISDRRPQHCLTPAHRHVTSSHWASDAGLLHPPCSHGMTLFWPKATLNTLNTSSSPLTLLQLNGPFYVAPSLPSMLSYVHPKAGYRGSKEGSPWLGPKCSETMEEVEGALPYPQGDKAKQRTRRHLIQPSYLFHHKSQRFITCLWFSLTNVLNILFLSFAANNSSSTKYIAFACTEY